MQKILSLKYLTKLVIEKCDFKNLYGCGGELRPNVRLQ